VITDSGGPLGKTLKVSSNSIEPHRNNPTGHVIVRAESHEAAARLFENHPHFAIFAGDSVETVEIVEIVEIMAMPGGQAARRPGAKRKAQSAVPIDP